MTALLLIGYLPDQGLPVNGPAHECIDLAGGAALALKVDPDDAAEEQGIMRWAVSQNKVLSAYSILTDVLPIPIGAVFSTKAALRDYLSQRASAISVGLARIAGHVEYGLYVEREQPNPVERPEAGESGRDYLLRRGRSRQSRARMSVDRREFVSELMKPFADLASDMKSLQNSAPKRLFGMSALVPRQAAEHLTQSLKEKAAGSGEFGLICRLVGPGPAFSFSQEL